MKSNLSLIIGDSSAFVSLASTLDRNHALARKISIEIKESKRDLILPGEIFTEVINVIGKKIDHKTAVRQGEEILNSKELIIEDTTPKIRHLAFERFKTQPKSVSFTDCLVMAFADEYDTKEIFGFDKIFKKNGYTRMGIDKT